MAQATGPTQKRIYALERCPHISWSSIDDHETVQKPRPVAVMTATTLQHAVPILMARMRNWVKTHFNLKSLYRFSCEYAAVEKLMEFKLKRGNLLQQWDTFKSLYLFANLSVLRIDGIWPTYIITAINVGSTIPRAVAILCRTPGCNLCHVTAADHVEQTRTSLVRCRRHNDANVREFQVQAKQSMANWLATKSFDRSRWTLQKYKLMTLKDKMQYMEWRDAFLLLNAESDEDSNDDYIWPCYDVQSFVVQ